MDPAKLAGIFSERPALHRFPASNSERVQQLSRIIVQDYAGEAAGIWEGATSGAELLRRVKALPGFGEQKAKISWPCWVSSWASALLVGKRSASLSATRARPFRWRTLPMPARWPECGRTNRRRRRRQRQPRPTPQPRAGRPAGVAGTESSDGVFGRGLRTGSSDGVFGRSIRAESSDGGDGQSGPSGWTTWSERLSGRPEPLARARIAFFRGGRSLSARFRPELDSFHAESELPRKKGLKTTIRGTLGTHRDALGR